MYAFFRAIVGLALVATALAYSIKEPKLETITISTEQFVVSPTDVVLHSTKIFPGSSAVLIDGEYVSTDTANDLFVDGTEMLTGTPAVQVSATITISTDTFVVNPTDIVIDGNTVAPGIPPLTVDGAIISADASGNLFADGTTLTATLTAQVSETITISTDTFVINPTYIVLDGTTVVPDAPTVTVDGEAISADASEDLFAGGTQMLAGPSSLTSSTSLASSTSFTSSTSVTSSTTQIFETITISTDVFVVNSTAIARDIVVRGWHGDTVWAIRSS